MKWIKRALPHVTIVLSLMTLTFFCIDRVNTNMAFMTSELSKWVFMLLAVCALLSSLMLAGFHWRDDARQARKRKYARERAAIRRMSESGAPVETGGSDDDATDDDAED